MNRTKNQILEHTSSRVKTLTEGTGHVSVALVLEDRDARVCQKRGEQENHERQNHNETRVPLEEMFVFVVRSYL